MIWQHEWIDWSLIGHIIAFVDGSQHIWPTDSLFPKQQNLTIPLTDSRLLLNIEEKTLIFVR